MQGATISLLTSLVELQATDPELVMNLEAAELRYSNAENRFEVITQILDYLLAVQRWDVIGTWAERAYTLEPEHWLSLYTLGFWHGACGRPDLAIPLFERLDHDYPENPVHVCLLIEACLGNLEFERAKRLLLRALQEAAHPDRFAPSDPTRFHYFRRLCILQGRLELAEGSWSGFSTQLLPFKNQPMAHNLPNIPLWDGTVLNARHLCVTRLGGFGDMLFFSSLLQDIVPHVEHVSLMVQPALQELMQTTFPTCRVLPYDLLSRNSEDQAKVATFVRDTPPDVQTSSVHLAAMARQMLNGEQPRFRPYLRVPQRARHVMKKTLQSLRSLAAGRSIIGVAWDRGQYDQPEVDGHQALLKKFSSLPVSELLAVINHPIIQDKFHFVALHDEETRREWPKPLPENLSRIYLHDTSFSETAAIIEACDFTLSIDMSIANLAAMLGKPTWLMLWHEGEWRFGHSGSSSPWIPNVRCFRQSTPGDWQSVGKAVIDALCQLALGDRVPTVVGH